MTPRKCTITAKQDISLFRNQHRYLKAENHEGYFHGLFGESDADGSSITIAFEHEDGHLVFLPECYFSLRFRNKPQAIGLAYEKAFLTTNREKETAQ